MVNSQRLLSGLLVIIVLVVVNAANDDDHDTLLGHHYVLGRLRRILGHLVVTVIVNVVGLLGLLGGTVVHLVVDDRGDLSALGNTLEYVGDGRLLHDRVLDQDRLDGLSGSDYDDEVEESDDRLNDKRALTRVCTIALRLRVIDVLFRTGLLPFLYLVNIVLGHGPAAHLLYFDCLRINFHDVGTALVLGLGLFGPVSLDFDLYIYPTSGVNLVCLSFTLLVLRDLGTVMFVGLYSLLNINGL